MKTRYFLAAVLFIALALSLVRLPVSAAPKPQTAYSTPTAQPDGRILYIVQAGDTCLRISLLAGVSVEYIRVTNLLNESCDIVEGQQLLIGVGAPPDSTPTPGPELTPSPVPPTPTPGAGGTATVCVLMYIDLNGDGLRQETEFGVDEGAVSVIGVSGPFTSQMETSSSLDVDDQDEDFDTEEPLRACFADLAPGTYTVSGGIPTGYNATTFTDVMVTLAPGDTTFVDFGVQEQTSEETGGGKKTSPLLGVLGAFLLLFGVGLGYYALWIRNKK